MRSRFLTAVLAWLTVTGCTRGFLSPGELPSAPTITVTELMITPVGGGALRVGGSAPITTSGGTSPDNGTLGAFARLSNGTGQYVDATWRSSDESVIAVVGKTLVGRGRGTVTITATFEGRSDTETFIGEGGIAGRWAGAYVVEQCKANSGSMAEVLCGAPGRTPGLAAVGATLPLTMDIAENDIDLTATVLLGSIGGTLTGKNRGSGFFFLQGIIEGSGGAIDIIQWDTRVMRDTVEGFIGYEIRIPGYPGLGAVVAKLTNVTRQ
jgi:hypothetical protein